MIWHADELNWNRAFEYAKEFYEEYGHLRIEKDYCVEDFNLGLWIQSQRRLKKKRYRNDTTKSCSLGFDRYDMGCEGLCLGNKCES